MTDAIGHGDYELGADIGGVKKSVDEAEKLIAASGDNAEKKYADSGAKAGTAFSKGLGLGLKAVGAAATAGFGLATKGLLDLQNVQADYTRETGATADEAARAGKAINAMAGRNLQPMAEIGSALAAVHTAMGLTGTAAEDTTQLFLRFSAATGQNATSAVKSFDDVLDAWGLTADKAAGLMDQLIASHQKYGTSVEGSQAALAAMAPQLKALNLGLDDGIGLLNLFASSGLDASTAQRALNTAISKLPPGTSLNDFIAHLATVTDDGARAQEAIQVFGTRAGAGLANAIKPGVGSLDAFKVSTEQAAGAMNRAADASESTFGAQVQLKIRAFGSALNDAFKDAGPLLTGLAAISSGAATLGVDDLLKKVAPKLIAGMKSIGEKAGDAIGDGISAVWQGATGTVIGNNIATRIEEIIAPGDSVVGRAVGRAGAAMGVVFGTAFAASETLALKLAYAIEALPGGAAVTGAIARAGAAMGLSVGAAIGLGLASAGVLAIGIPLAQWAQQGIDAEKAKVVVMVRDAIASASVDGLHAAEADLRGRLASARGAHQSALAEFYQAQLTDVQTALGNIAHFTSAAAPAIAAAAEGAGTALSEPIVQHAEAASRATRISAADMLATINQSRADLAAAANAAASAIFDPEIKAAEAAATRIAIAQQTKIINSKKSTAAEIQEATNRRDQLNKTLFVQLSDLSTYGTRAQQLAKLGALLTSKAVAREYKNGTPEQRAAIDAWRQGIRDKMSEIEEGSKRSADRTVVKYAGGLSGGKGTVRRDAGAMANAARIPMSDLEDDAGGFGRRTAVAYAQGLISGLADKKGAIRGAVGAFKNILAASSPPGPESPLHLIDKWGERTGAAWTDGMVVGLRRGARGVRSALSGAMPADLASGSLGFMAQAATTIRVVHDLRVTPDAVRALRDGGYDERRIARELADASGLFTNLQQRIALTGA